MGFAQVFAEFFSKKTGVQFKPSGGALGGGLVAAGVVHRGNLDGGGNWRKAGIASVNVSAIPTRGEVYVTFDLPVTHLSVAMIGMDVNLTPWGFSPRWISGSVPNGQKKWTIELRHISDGSLALDPLHHSYQILGYIM